MGRKKKSHVGETLELAVSFSNVNIGDASASVSISIDRHSFSIEQADEILCGHRVLGTIIGRPIGNDSDQPNIPLEGVEEDIVLTTTFDIKSFRVNRKVIGCGLTVNLADVDITKICQFAKRNGKFVIQQVDELPKNGGIAEPTVIQPDEFPDSPTEAA